MVKNVNLSEFISLGVSMRLDAYLAAYGFAASRTRAKNLIESGRVGVDGKTETKPAFDVPENAVVTLAEGQNIDVTTGI